MCIIRFSSFGDHTISYYSEKGLSFELNLMQSDWRWLHHSCLVSRNDG